MPKAKPVSLTVAGRKCRFDTLAAAAIHFGLLPSTVVSRHRQYGWTLRQALEIDERPPREFTHVSVTVDGDAMTFPSFAAAAAHFGVNKDTAYQRHYFRGWSLEETFGVVAKAIAHSQNKQLVCDIDGVINRFESHKSAAEKFGIDPRLFRHRLSVRGWSLKEALELVPRREPKRSCESVTVYEGGKPRRFGSLGAAAKHYGVEYHTAWTRQKKGYTLEQSLELEPAPLHARSRCGEIYVITQKSTGVLYVGQTVTSILRRWAWHLKQSQLGRKSPLHAAIRQCGESDFVIKRVATAGNQYELNKLERDWVAKLDSRFPKGFNLTRGGGAGPVRTEPFQIDGIEFDSVSHACRHFGVSTALIADRTQRQEMSIEDAFKTEIYRGKEIFVRGKRFVSHKDAIAHFGVDDAVVRKRLAEGWDVEDAFFATDQRGTPIQIQGVIYPSISDAAERFGIPVHRVHQRITKFGWTPEEAVDLVSRPKRQPSGAKAVRFRFKGRVFVFASFREAARMAGISPQRLRYRRTRKWSWPDALGLIKRRAARSKR